MPRDRFSKGRGADAFLSPAMGKDQKYRNTEIQKAGQPAQKATYLLSGAAVQQLEEVWSALRRQHPGRKRDISRSRLVEIAIEALAEDWEKNQERSRAAKGVAI